MSLFKKSEEPEPIRYMVQTSTGISGRNIIVNGSPGLPIEEVIKIAAQEVYSYEWKNNMLEDVVVYRLEKIRAAKVNRNLEVVV